jgi:threonine synthase
MDIQIASNFERLYYETARRDGVETSRAFRAFTETGVLDLPPAALSEMKALFSGASVTEDDTARTILATLNETGEVIDPHTAVAVAAANRATLPDGMPLVILSTAHPAKFPEAVQAATGAAPPTPASARRLDGKAERFDRLPADAETIKTYIRDFARR